MALFSDAALNLCDRARLGKAIDSGTYASGYGSQLFVDGLDFVLGELAYASVGGVLFWDPRGGDESLNAYGTLDLLFSPKQRANSQW
jgi:hypothetical protein